MDFSVYKDPYQYYVPIPQVYIVVRNKEANKSPGSSQPNSGTVICSGILLWTWQPLESPCFDASNVTTKEGLLITQRLQAMGTNMGYRSYKQQKENNMLLLLLLPVHLAIEQQPPLPQSRK